MRRLRKNPISRLRAIRLYLLIISSCTLILFCFSIISANEQHERLESISSELNAKQIALELEKRMEELADNCLNRQSIGQLPSVVGKEDSLEDIKSLREFFKVLKESHSIARHFFVLSGNQLIFPRITSPSVQDLQSLLPRERLKSIRVFAELMHDGENWETRLGEPSRAANAYQAAEKLNLSDRLTALALFRKARALEKAGFSKAADEACRTLITSYGDEYDESQTPYILALAADNNFPLGRRLFNQQSLLEIYRNLTAGKWELSAHQVDRYLTSLEMRLKLNTGDRPSSEFLDSFRVARAVSQQPEAFWKGQTFEVLAKSFMYESKPYRIYRITIPADNGHDLVVGFSVSMPWVITSFLPEFFKQAQYRGLGTVSVLESSDLDNTGQSRVPFLDFWKLGISSEGMSLSKLAVSRELWFIGLSAFMFLSVLGLCLVLLIRVSSDIRWFQLRADFVSGVSHEFKTPLSLIRLYSETLAHDDQDYSAEDRKNYIRIIARESERMSRMIDNVLDFSNMERGRQRSNLQEGDLTSTISEAINNYSEYLTWRGFSVKSSFWPNLPPVKFDPEQVSQVLLNLMDNARKYSGLSRIIRVNVWVDRSEVVVEVQDNGIGIAADEKEKIFQPFYRISKGNEKGGCGLGLYLVDQVMKEHGGRVEVESEVDRGSRFRLIFPASSSQKLQSRTHILTNARSEEQA